uniref:Uncharacterized protein n=1 Tax=Arundo donax TaxID=35708 RepID=A0A0A8Z316_ARUDO
MKYLSKKVLKSQMSDHIESLIIRKMKWIK